MFDILSLLNGMLLFYYDGAKVIFLKICPENQSLAFNK